MSQASEKAFLKICLPQLIESVWSGMDEKLHAFMILADLGNINVLDTSDQGVLLEKRNIFSFQT